MNKRASEQHRWDLTPKEAIRLQQRLADQIEQIPLDAPLRLIAGGAVAFSPDGSRLVAGWAVWDLKTGLEIETVVDVHRVTFSYVPGLLSFREAPGLLAAARRLKNEPDVFMLDGQGLAHPRRFGLACHVGLLLDRPSLGCAKSRLCGTHDEPGLRTGCSRRLIHKGKIIGRVVRTRDGVKPVYISIGHKITLDAAVRLTRRCCRRYRLPEPTRLAHRLVSEARHELFQ